MVLRIQGSAGRALAGCFLTTVTMFVASAANAADLIVVSGELIGASNVCVNGSLYDVEFVDGTCAGVYGSCVNSNFTWKTLDATRIPAQALLDQVFLDGAFPFDSEPALTTGCESSEVRCQAIFPYNKAFSVFVGGAQNHQLETGDNNDATFAISPGDDTTNGTGFARRVWVRWAFVGETCTPIPIPALSPLPLALLLSLLGLTAWRRLRGAGGVA